MKSRPDPAALVPRTPRTARRSTAAAGVRVVLSSLVLATGLSALSAPAVLSAPVSAAPRHTGDEAGADRPDPARRAAPQPGVRPEEAELLGAEHA
ncbi:hypothetical protein GPJ59_36695, partial [Streptomyces bambusae]|nr:hypothetical protein [Streptomyces bambusae]